MSKFACAAIVSALAFAAVVPTTASGGARLPIVISAGIGSAAGVAAVGGFIGFIAALDIYGSIRRITCSGNFLNFGGPDFSEPLRVRMNVMTSQRPDRS